MWKAAIILAIWLAVIAFDGTAQVGEPQFDVVSVKPSQERAEPIRFPLGAVYAPSTSLLSLVAAAYGVTVNQVIGGPVWIRSERYEIQAKAPSAAGRAELGKMLQGALAQRFGLKLHRETREAPIYALTLSPGGVKVKKAQENEAPAQLGEIRLRGDMKSIARSLANLMLVTPADPTGKLIQRGEIRPVFDRTNLEGTYEIDVNLTPDVADFDTFALVQRALRRWGLDLVATKGPVEFLVIGRTTLRKLTHTSARAILPPVIGCSTNQRRPGRYPHV